MVVWTFEVELPAGTVVEVSLPATVVDPESVWAVPGDPAAVVEAEEAVVAPPEGVEAAIVEVRMATVVVGAGVVGQTVGPVGAGSGTESYMVIRDISELSIKLDRNQNREVTKVFHKTHEDKYHPLVFCKFEHCPGLQGL